MPDNLNSTPLNPSPDTQPNIGGSVLPSQNEINPPNSGGPVSMPVDSQDIPPPPQGNIFPPSSVPVESVATPQQLPVPPQPTQALTPSAPQSSLPGQSDGASRPKAPVKTLLIVLGALGLLAIAAFLVKTLFFSTPPAPKIVTINYWGLWEDSQILSELIKEYEGSHTGIKINYQKQSKEDYRERLVNNLAKVDAGPDIFRFHNTWVPMLSGQLSSLPPEVMDPTTYQSIFYPSAVADLRRNTDIVGIPLMTDGLAMYINEDIFANSGKVPPVTWDELRRTASELTIRDEQGSITQSGAALGRTENIDHWQDVLSLMMLQDGADLANPSGENAEKPLKFYTVFATDDLVWDETLPPSTQAFAGGRVAMYFGPSWRTFEIKKQNPNLKFKIVPVPQLPKDEQDSIADVNWATYWAEGVWSKSKAQKESWEFLKFLSQKDSLQKMYAQGAKTRLFGEVYPRPDMASLLLDDPYTNAYASQAKTAKSWYLTDRTYDGPTGINTRISAYYQDAVNGIVIDGKDPDEVLPTVAQGVAQVLQSYNQTR